MNTNAWKRYMQVANDVLHAPFGALSPFDIEIKPPNRLRVHRREKVGISNSKLTDEFTQPRLQAIISEYLQNEFDKVMSEQQFLCRKYDLFFQDYVALDNKIRDGYGSPANYMRYDELKMQLDDLSKQMFEDASRLNSISEVALINTNCRIVSVHLVEHARTPMYDVNIA